MLTGSISTKQLNLLSQNKKEIKNSFDTANKKCEILPEIIRKGYASASFEMESLFTNVPLERTITIILDCIFNKKPVTSQP